MMTTLEVLRGARALLSAPDRWTKRTSARDAAGVATYAASPFAVCWCLEGALLRVTGDGGWGSEADLAYRGAANVLGAHARNLGYEFFSDWQDQPERTHAGVLGFLDRAIAAEEGKVDG